MEKIIIQYYRNRRTNVKSKHLHLLFTLDEKLCKEDMNTIIKIDKTRMEKPLQY